APGPGRTGADRRLDPPPERRARFADAGLADAVTRSFPAGPPASIVEADDAAAGRPAHAVRPASCGAGALAAAPPAPAPQGLSAAERAALPFRIDLPPGFQLVEGRAAPGAHVYSARKAGKTYLMIYAGPSSQFPIYDGEQVTAGGRISVVTTEGPRRIAMEHLFQRSAQPA